MSERGVELVQGLHSAFNRGEIEAALDYLHPDYELHPALIGAGGRDYYRGLEEAREFFELITDTWEVMTVESTEMIELPGGRILAVEIWRVRGRDGIELETHLTDVYAFRDGLIARVDGYRDKAEALQAAGQRE